MYSMFLANKQQLIAKFLFSFERIGNSFSSNHFLLDNLSIHNCQAIVHARSFSTPNGLLAKVIVYLSSKKSLSSSVVYQSRQEHFLVFQTFPALVQIRMCLSEV
jgi:hypothetical protein